MNNIPPLTQTLLHNAPHKETQYINGDRFDSYAIERKLFCLEKTIIEEGTTPARPYPHEIVTKGLLAHRRNHNTTPTHLLSIKLCDEHNYNTPLSKLSPNQYNALAKENGITVIAYDTATQDEYTDTLRKKHPFSKLDDYLLFSPSVEALRAFLERAYGKEKLFSDQASMRLESEASDRAIAIRNLLSDQTINNTGKLWSLLSEDVRKAYPKKLGGITSTYFFGIDLRNSTLGTKQTIKKQVEEKARELELKTVDIDQDKDLLVFVAPKTNPMRAINILKDLKDAKKIKVEKREKEIALPEQATLPLPAAESIELQGKISDFSLVAGL